MKYFNIALCVTAITLIWLFVPVENSIKVVVTVLFVLILLFWLFSGQTIHDWQKEVEAIHRSEVQASGLPMFEYPGEYDCKAFAQKDPKKPYRSQFMTEEAFETAHGEWLHWHFNK